MSSTIRLLLTSFLLISSSIEAQASDQVFESFEGERGRVAQSIKCTRSNTQAGQGNYGALFSCIGGSAETVKIFLNEDTKARGKVKDLKFMWNDYTRNTGNGVHADKKVAAAWLARIADLYGPEKKAEIEHMFSSNRDDVVYTKTNIFVYTISHGPAIAERMFVVTKR